VNINIKMPPLIALLILAVAAYALSVRSASPRDLDRVADAVTNSVYVATENWKDCGGGSGTVFLRTNAAGERLRLIVTAGHVMGGVSATSRWHAVFSQGTQYRWTNSILPLYKCESAPADVGVFLITGEWQPAVDGMPTKIDFTPPAGTAIFSVGAPFGPEQLQSVDFCTLAHAKRAISRIPVFQFTCVTYPGSSGGGVYTAEGVWIGVITHYQASGIGFACPATACHALLSANGLDWVLDPSKSAPSRDLLIRQVTK
jgi:hypothetical protein